MPPLHPVAAGPERQSRPWRRHLVVACSLRDTPEMHDNGPCAAAAGKPGGGVLWGKSGTPHTSAKLFNPLQLVIMEADAYSAYLAAVALAQSGRKVVALVRTLPNVVRHCVYAMLLRRC